MIWHSLAELFPQYVASPPLTTKIVIPLRSSFWEICFPPAERGHVEDTIKTLSQLFDQSPFSQSIESVNCD